MDRQKSSQTKPKTAQKQSKRALATSKPKTSNNNKARKQQPRRKQQQRRAMSSVPVSTATLPPSLDQKMAADTFFASEEPTIHSSPNQPGGFGLTGHEIRVKKLYRKLLRDHWSWYGLNEDTWVVRAGQLRDEFEKYRNVTDVGEIETLIKEAEVYLYETEDPNPYRPLMHPNGGVFGRNEPLPRTVLRPVASMWDCDRDYHVEERTVRYLHAAPEDPDYAPTHSKYAVLKIKRGEYWHDPANPATFEPVVAEYCKLNGIKFEPNADEIVHATWGEGMPEPQGDYNPNDFHWTKPSKAQV